MLQKQLRSLPLEQLQKIHDILSAGGIIVKQEKPHTRNTPTQYQNLIDFNARRSHQNISDSFLKVKCKDESAPGGSVSHSPPKQSNDASKKFKNKISINFKENISVSEIGKRNSKGGDLSIQDPPFDLQIEKMKIQTPPSQQRKDVAIGVTTHTDDDVELVREAIVNKILCEEKTTSSMMVDGVDSRDQKIKRSINLYQEGLSIIEDVQANLTETITDNENQYIQYQEVGTINNMMNARFDQSRSREVSTREYNKLKMKMMDESTSNQNNQGMTYSMNSPGSQNVRELNDY